ncbi:GNAT family N-acetyltransferase [Pelomonas sp. KK5]|uniref:GNAT family N-acetyltransferase n=1 Tax=Pelomonas sp. KK5 TaxID=1855730 RepID=UPI00097C7423|nr:GNAT family N-acetyltransferase [Pelomonas sp. KK5]
MPESLVSFVAFEPSHIAPARSLWDGSEGVGLSSADEPPALRSFLLRNPGLSFVALQADQVVGTVLCGHDGRRGLIHHLVVAPGNRRQGIGRVLLRRGLAALFSEGIQKTHLLVFKSNASGLAFWRSVGAEERTSLALFSLATQNAG